MIRFAIIRFTKKVDDAGEIVLEYDEQFLRDRLMKVTSEILADEEKPFRTKVTRARVTAAVGEAFDKLVKEFKEQTVRIT